MGGLDVFSQASFQCKAIATVYMRTRIFKARSRVLGIKMLIEIVLFFEAIATDVAGERRWGYRMDKTNVSGQGGFPLKPFATIYMWAGEYRGRGRVLDFDMLIETRLYREALTTDLTGKSWGTARVGYPDMFCKVAI